MENVAIEFHDHEFWHADPLGIIIHNAKLRGGWTASVSYSIENTPDLSDAATPYAVFHQDKEKEEVWERIRRDEFPARPSRLNALYLFMSKADVDLAMASWWRGEQRIICSLRVPKVSILHVADTRLLDARAEDWEENARKYWDGIMSDNPFPEAILHGLAFIPNIDGYPHPWVNREGQVGSGEAV